jgi:hypothetical protein
MTEVEDQQEQKSDGLSSAKREDIWALLVAAAVMAASLAAPEGVYTFFKKMLYLL